MAQKAQHPSLGPTGPAEAPRAGQRHWEEGLAPDSRDPNWKLGKTGHLGHTCLGRMSSEHREDSARTFAILGVRGRPLPVPLCLLWQREPVPPRVKDTRPGQGGCWRPALKRQVEGSKVGSRGDPLCQPTPSFPHPSAPPPCLHTCVLAQACPAHGEVGTLTAAWEQAPWAQGCLAVGTQT